MKTVTNVFFTSMTHTGRIFEANLQATRQSQLMTFTAYGGVKWMEKMKMLISILP